ncbi:MAG: hypothetical protein P1U46_04345 [Patescibacteria group bacterium]|nr:hypothetical protein [Patescibacteria group bacterium]
MWDNIDSPNTEDNMKTWDIYNDTLETILAFQLSQNSEIAQNANLN